MNLRFELIDLEVYPEVDQQVILYRLCNLTFLIDCLSKEYGIDLSDVISQVRQPGYPIKRILEDALTKEPVGSFRWQALSKYLNYLLGGDTYLESLIPNDKRADSEARAQKLIIKLLEHKVSDEN